MTRFRLLPVRRRRRVPAGERILGGAVLLATAGVVAWFVATGTRRLPEAAPAPPAAAAPAPGGFPLKSPAGWPRGEIERYDEVSVFEKIDGKADAYLLYRFRELLFATWSDPANPETYVDVYAYDMGEPLDAYGIYRGQRGAAEERLPVADEGCAAGAAAFLRRGKFYVEALASGPEAAAEARALAGALASALPPGSPPAEDPPWFPAAGRIKLGFERKSVLGDETLVDAFVARYEDGTQVAVCELATPAAAETAAKGAGETFGFLGIPVVTAAQGSRAVIVIGFPAPERGNALLSAILAGMGGAR